MEHDLKEIKKLRKLLGLTQAQLAKRAGVSQSLIAKIESGKIDPTYSKATQLLNTLNDLSQSQDLKAGDIMTKKVVIANASDKIHDIIKLMKRFQISQVPVIESRNYVGSVSESTILNAIIEEKGTHIRDIMDETPPIIVPNSSISVVTHLLKYYPLILVADKGRIQGIITKSDLISRLYG